MLMGSTRWNTGRTRSFVTLDGLRGVAALFVVARHAPTFFSSVSIYVLPSPEVAPIPMSIGPFFESYLAVDFFFALSGFVLAYAYGDRLRGGMSATRFMTIRLIRLYPLYFLALLIALVPFLWGLAHGGNDSAYSMSNWLFAVLFLPSLASPYLFPLNGPAWSLFFELLANAALGLFGRHLKKSLLLLIVTFAGSALLFAVYFRWLGFGSAGLGAMSDGWQWRAFGAGVVRVAFSFFAGILVFQTWKIWHPRIQINVPPIFLVAALSAVLVANPPDRFQAAFDLVATLLVFPILIFLGASSAPSGLTSRLFRRIGAASYAVYVLQSPLYVLSNLVVAHFKGGSLSSHLPWTWGAAFMVFVLAVAIIADKYFDRPVREAISSYLRETRFEKAYPLNVRDALLARVAAAEVENSSDLLQRELEGRNAAAPAVVT